jgi:hypothetical protein
MKTSVVIVLPVMLICCFAQTSAARGDESLRTVIDQRLQPPAGVVPVRCSDAEFLRRVSLDLNGMPPTSDEARSFLADASNNKREQLVDRLLASPHYARHMASTLDLMLMERRANTHVTADEWQAWLMKSTRENKPWNVLAREILTADGDDPNQRPAARFVLDRGAEPNVLTHDISRIFFGRDMQCAQCHDHPIVADYLQSDYQGLLAYIAPGYTVVRKEGDKQVTMYAERAGSDLSFESVFVKGTQHRTGPRMPDDLAADEPFFLPGDEYQIAPADAVKSVPKFSRRGKLAEFATNGTNQAFNQNIANRLWAHMFGRGLVHPVDMHHPDNPATDPELLRILGEQFAAKNYDIKAFLRELALSETYQRSFDAPADLLSPAAQAAAQIAQAEQQRGPLEETAKESAKAYSAALDAWHQAEAATLPVAGEVDAARNAYAEAKKKVDEATKALADVTTQQQTKQTIASSLQQAAEATQKAAEALPDAKDLPETAKVLLARSAAFTAEAVALTKTVEEKTAAVVPLTEALNAARPPVEAAIAKLAPLKAALTQSEQSMLAARRKSADDSQRLGAIERQLSDVRQFLKLSERNQAIVAATAAVSQSETEMTSAQQQVTEYVPVVAQKEAAVKAATEMMTAATNGLNVANAEHTRLTELASAITAALGSAEAAQQKSGEDATLADVVTKLKERSTVAQAATVESKSQVDAATVVTTAASESMAAANKTMAETAAEQTRLQQAMLNATNAVSAAKSDLTTKQSELTSTVSELDNRMVTNFTVASLKPLTPEQLCWTVFRVTGVYDRYWQGEVAELDKSTPLTDEQKQNAEVMVARNVELEQKTFDKLKGNVGTFVTFYGAAAGQPQGDFFSTADQALFSSNGGSINSWVVPAGDNVTDRVIKQTDPRVAAEEIYLAVLTRMPTEDEVTEVTNYLGARTADRNVAAQELVWAVLNSAEFRFNH